MMSKTVLLHLGHLGLASSDSITYIRHRGHPTRTIDVTVDDSWLLLLYPELFALVCWSSDRQDGRRELSQNGADACGDPSTVPRRLDLGGDRLRVSSSFGLLALLLLFIISLDQLSPSVIKSTEEYHKNPEWRSTIYITSWKWYNEP